MRKLFSKSVKKETELCKDSLDSFDSIAQHRPKLEFPIKTQSTAVIDDLKDSKLDIDTVQIETKSVIPASETQSPELDIPEGEKEEQCSTPKSLFSFSLILMIT